MEHTFVICAYKESDYLEQCIQSLKLQSYPSKIILSTSTPNKLISDLCKKYEIPFFINEGKSGLAEDWNFAYKLASTPLITLAHQDDVYEKKYTEKIVEAWRMSNNALILFSDYFEYRDTKKIKDNKNLKIKRLMLSPLKCKKLQASVFVRRRILSLGNPICCPSVTYVAKNLPQKIFESGMGSNSDWEAWEKISRIKGKFVYIPEYLMSHRIHEASTTSEIIGEHRRQKEDLEIFRKFWPEFIAKMICKVYSNSEKSNDL